MATLTIKIDMDNAAFTVESNDERNGTPDPAPEVVRLLIGIAFGFTESGDVYDRAIRDFNGHLVGTVEVTE